MDKKEASFKVLKASSPVPRTGSVRLPILYLRLNFPEAVKLSMIPALAP